MRLLETDSNANIDINAATAIGVYTATAGRLVFVRVMVDAVAGGGDYIVYVTLRLGGAGSSYRLIPLTTATAAAALTAIGFVSGAIPMDASDVLTVYIDGLAGDTTTPDTRVDYYEMDYLRPATAGRTLVVDANGLADANTVKVGPTGAGTAQTARDLGASVLQTGDAYAIVNHADYGNEKLAKPGDPMTIARRV
jgi:hypothetical protein